MLRRLMPVLAFALLGGVACEAPAQPVESEVLLDAAHHPLGSTLRAVLVLPEGASAAKPVPACLVVHGSGGLFRENAPGEACGPELEGNFRGVADLLAAQGVAALLPSSFASRDPRFCEDNHDDFLQFATAPFFNPGDVFARDGSYSRRRVVIRSLDLLAASRWLCAREDIDCSRTCVVGASNGGTALLGYVANELGRHLAEFTDTTTQREHESGSAFADRQLAFDNFPAIAADIDDQLEVRNLPRFAQAVSPGCSLRALVPTISPEDPDFDPVAHLDDLYYPAFDVELHLEIGLLDDVPDACHGDGIRELQARAFESLSGATHSRYLVHTHEGADHDLLGEREATLHARLSALVQHHFFPPIFADGFEAPPPAP